MGPPGGSCVNLSAGPSVSDIISEGALQPLLKKLQPRVHPTSLRGRGPVEKPPCFLSFSFPWFSVCLPVSFSFPPGFFFVLSFVLILLFVLSPFPLVPSSSLAVSFLSPGEILIYPWTRHILYPLSSPGSGHRYLSAARYRARPGEMIFLRNCLFEIPTEIFARIINRYSRTRPAAEGCGRGPQGRTTWLDKSLIIYVPLFDCSSGIYPFVIRSLSQDDTAEKYSLDKLNHY